MRRQIAACVAAAGSVVLIVTGCSAGSGKDAPEASVPAVAAVSPPAPETPPTPAPTPAPSRQVSPSPFVERPSAKAPSRSPSASKPGAPSIIKQIDTPIPPGDRVMGAKSGGLTEEHKDFLREKQPKQVPPKMPDARHAASAEYVAFDYYRKLSAAVDYGRPELLTSRGLFDSCVLCKSIYDGAVKVKSGELKLKPTEARIAHYLLPGTFVGIDRAFVTIRTAREKRVPYSGMDGDYVGVWTPLNQYWEFSLVWRTDKWMVENVTQLLAE